jgi:hypothetical protein
VYFYAHGKRGHFRGSKPEPQKIPLPQIQPGEDGVQVDHLAAALERVVPVQQDMPPGRRRHPGDLRHGLAIAAGLTLRQQVR